MRCEHVFVWRRNGKTTNRMRSVDAIVCFSPSFIPSESFKCRAKREGKLVRHVIEDHQEPTKRFCLLQDTTDNASRKGRRLRPKRCRAAGKLGHRNPGICWLMMYRYEKYLNSHLTFNRATNGFWNIFLSFKSINRLNCFDKKSCAENHKCEFLLFPIPVPYIYVYI